MQKEVKPTCKENQGGPTLGYVSVSLLEKDGLFFKDFEGDGVLYPYEDWRLSPLERAKDLSERLSVEEMAGLMMYSPHQMVPSLPGMPFEATYGGEAYDPSMPAYSISDQLEGFLKEEHIRHVLLMTYQDTETAVCWNNAMQAICEEMPHGIPANICSDPRHGAGSAGAEYRSEGSGTSKWPEGLAMAATFDPDLCREAAKIMAKEYRALGIATALSPQVDLGTEPRWMRIEDTFGADPSLVTAMSRAYCEGMQEDEGEGGWGMTSVNAMAKHWPGGGPCEGGRDAHYPFGKFAVYPGKALTEHLKPFLEGAFDLQGKTKKVAAVMPYYTVSFGVDPSGEMVGNSYSKYIIKDMLRGEAGFDGVICTDW
ncbi:MAG: beta-glucosidase, partial [Blautia sp.]|nr:beta-glucosidase [Blautia sp.]